MKPRPTKTNPSIDNDLRAEIEEILRALHLYYDKVYNAVLPDKKDIDREKATQKLSALFTQYKSQIEREARIAELSQFKVPEQYEHFAKLMGDEACTICGFNAIKAKKYVDDRLQALNSKDSERS